MAFLRKTKKEETAVVPTENAKATPAAFKDSGASVLLRPRVTEKATMKAEENVYTFEISSRASKNDVAHAIKHEYGVLPVKINVVKLPRKSVFIRGKKGATAAVKKAYVYLKKGDKIEFV